MEKKQTKPPAERRQAVASERVMVTGFISALGFAPWRVLAGMHAFDRDGFALRPPTSALGTPAMMANTIISTKI
jgi:hypothetical protein